MKIVRRLLAVLAVNLLSGWPTAQALTCSNPDSAYALNVDGTVLDTRNGLIWKQCAEGQSGPTCSGSATTHTWSAALKLAASSTFAGASDWRLPNIKELSHLAEKCRSTPAINATIFLGTPSNWFWSASPVAPGPAVAWSVGFHHGGTVAGNQSYYDHVRLVRSGQFFDSFDWATQQVITFGAAPSLLVVGGTALLSATGGASGLPVVFNSQTPTVCSVSGNNVSGVARGTCSIAANQAGNSIYSVASEKTQSFPVSSAPLLIDNLVQNAGFEGGTTAWTQSSSGGYLLIVAGSTLPAHAGSHYALLGGYDSATDVIEQSLSIPANATIANLEFWTQITTKETSCRSCDTLAVALYSTGGQYLRQLTSLSGQNASSGWVKNSGFDLTDYQGQSVRLRFTASTNASNDSRFLIDDVKLSASVLYTQSITFDAAPSVFEGGTGNVSASASSGLPLTFSSSTSRTCTLLGQTVSGVSPGTCIITAHQAGDTGYLAAPQATQSFSITTIDAILAPAAPGMSAPRPGRGSATLFLSAPSSNGGAPIVEYAATCTANGQSPKSASSSGLTLTVRGLKGGIEYACTATARNAFQTSSPSTAQKVTPQSGGNSLTPILMLLLD